MKKVRQIVGSLLSWTFITIFMLIGLSTAVFGIYLFQLNGGLPSDMAAALQKPTSALPTVLYDRNNNQVEEIFVRRRIIVPFEKFPPHLIQALLASEDTQFFHHFGINPIRMLKASWVNAKAGRFVEGASTITQQTARMMLLTTEKRWERKLKEILMALKFERLYSKERLLTLYLNKANFGNAEGVEAAAQGYFGKHVEDISLAESALLVGILPSPTRYSPAVNPDLAKTRRSLVLRRMFEEGYISDEERKSANQEPIRLSQTYDGASEATAYYVEYVRQYLLQKFGAEKLYKEGLRVYLSMDLEYQIQAHEALRKGIIEVSKRQGYRGVEEHLALDAQGELPQREIHRVTLKNKLILGNVVQGVVTRVTKSNAIITFGQEEGVLEWSHLQKWKVRQTGKNKKIVQLEQPSQLLKGGDVIQVKLEDWDPQTNRFRLTLHQEPLVNGALLSIDPRNGMVLAMSGGYEQDKSGFNRALEAKRQPGSVFHPIIYTAALDAGYTLASPLVDSPRNIKENPLSTEETRLRGNVSLRSALAESLRHPTIGLVEDIGRQRILETAEKFGLQADAKNNVFTALGSFPTTLQEMVFAHSVFANEGLLAKPIYIMRIEDNAGTILEENIPDAAQVLSQETAFLITDVLKGVADNGLAKQAKEIERPSAGKTGVANHNVDAWYIGYVPQVLTGIYIGFDRATPMGIQETGGRAATPIWVDYMKAIVGNLPTERFVQPPQIVTVKIHESGRRVGPCDPVETTFDEKFKRGTEPLVDTTIPQNCDIQTETEMPDSQIEDGEVEELEL